MTNTILFYNSVPTNDADLSRLHATINEGIQSKQLRHIRMTPAIIAHCIKRLKKSKDDGNVGFKSDHLIYGGGRLHVLLSMLFNCTLRHG